MIKVHRFFYVVLILTISTLFATSVNAVHSTNVSVSPDLANCNDLSANYTVYINNSLQSQHSILEVRVYDDSDFNGITDPGIVSFSCGNAPSGWNLNDQLITNHYCQYQTGIQSQSKIFSGKGLNFSFTAILDDTNEQCGNSFRIATIDNATPFGQVSFKLPVVQVDCVDPTIHKRLSSPSILINEACNPNVMSCDYWVSPETVISVLSNDTESADECNLGLDYCEWRYSLDGGPFSDYERFEGSGFDDLEFNFSFNEDSNHDVQIRCVDVAGNIAILNETDKVDGTSPISTKQFTGPQKIENNVEWINTLSRIELNAIDPDPTQFQCNIGVKATWYLNVLAIDVGDEEELSCSDPQNFCSIQVDSPYSQESYDGCINDKFDACSQLETPNTNSWYDCIESSVVGDCSVSSDWKLYRGDPIAKAEESCHIFEYFSIDDLGNEEEINVNCFYVDKTAPNISKLVGMPALGECPPQPGNISSECFIGSNTNITLQCADQLPHPSGNETIFWKYRFTEDGINYNEGLMENCDELTAEGFCKRNNNNFNITFPEQSLHELEFYCVDGVNKTSLIDLEYFRVDNEPPIITKEIIGPRIGECPPEPNSDDICFISANETTLRINVSDGESAHASSDSQLNCTWQYTFEEELFGPYVENEYPFDITFAEDSSHQLTIMCSDVVGNIAIDVETFLVDDFAPVTVKSYSEPIFTCRDWCNLDCQGNQSCQNQCEINMCGGEDLQGHLYPQYITSDTLITLNATDEKVGINNTIYRTLLIQDPEGYESCFNAQLCNPQSYSEYVDGEIEFKSYVESFNLSEDSCHVIEYLSIDHLENQEALKYQCVFVDNIEPLANKTIGQPKKPGIESDWLVSQDTPITLSCEDQEPHPVGHERLCFKVSLEVDDFVPFSSFDPLTQDYCPTELDGNDFCCVASPFEFNFLEDSRHELIFICEDALGNGGTQDVETFSVETVTPVTTHQLLGPVFSTQHCDEECNTVTYIDTASTVQLISFDPDPHPSGVNESYFRTSLVPDTYCEFPNTVCTPCVSENCSEFEVYQEPFGIDEESCHMIEYYSQDMLGNSEGLHHLCTYVDKTAPNTTKNFSGAQFPEDGDTNITHYVNTLTNISLSAIDPLPHPSGVNSTFYKITVLENEEDWHYCQVDCNLWEPSSPASVTSPSEPWTQWTGESFRMQEESCHIIEYYSIDNVEKNESIKHQCVLVDETPPLPDKVVGYPRSTINSEDDYTFKFYPEVNGRCFNGENNSIDCWKVTLLTPISLACADPQPHPVNNERVCFKVDVDDQDSTEEYCSSYGGNYNINEDGFCCAAEELDNFYFSETSEHNLQFYCIDALGNQGPVDDEKFKVEDTKFSIWLNHKWNLISTPVNLLDDSLDSVFEGYEESILSVWSFENGSQWIVYTPDFDNLNDDYTKFEVGKGYWVLVNNTAGINLTIGGSLLNPATTPPAIPIKGDAWNLIGYYGADGLDDYHGPIGGGKNASCMLNSIGDSIFDKGFSALWTYWEEDNPDQWKPLDKSSQMDPGAGYWIFATEGAQYAPSTTCNI